MRANPSGRSLVHLQADLLKHLGIVVHVTHADGLGPWPAEFLDQAFGHVKAILSRGQKDPPDEETAAVRMDIRSRRDREAIGLARYRLGVMSDSHAAILERGLRVFIRSARQIGVERLLRLGIGRVDEGWEYLVRLPTAIPVGQGAVAMGRFNPVLQQLAADAIDVVDVADRGPDDDDGAAAGQRLPPRGQEGGVPILATMDDAGDLEGLAVDFQVDGQVKDRLCPGVVLFATMAVPPAALSTLFQVHKVPDDEWQA